MQRVSTSPISFEELRYFLKANRPRVLEPSLKVFVISLSASPTHEPLLIVVPWSADFTCRRGAELEPSLEQKRRAAHPRRVHPADRRARRRSGPGRRE